MYDVCVDLSLYSDDSEISESELNEDENQAQSEEVQEQADFDLTDGTHNLVIVKADSGECACCDLWETCNRFIV